MNFDDLVKGDPRPQILMIWDKAIRAC